MSCGYNSATYADTCPGVPFLSKSTWLCVLIIASSRYLYEARLWHEQLRSSGCGDVINFFTYIQCHCNIIFEISQPYDTSQQEGTEISITVGVCHFAITQMYTNLLQTRKKNQTDWEIRYRDALWDKKPTQTNNRVTKIKNAVHRGSSSEKSGHKNPVLIASGSLGLQNQGWRRYSIVVILPATVSFMTLKFQM